MLTVFSLVIFGAFGFGAHAQNHGHHDAHSAADHHQMADTSEHRAMMLPCVAEELAEDLDLTAVQLERLEIMRDQMMASEDHHAAMAASEGVLEVLTEEQRAALETVDYDRLQEVMMARMHAAEADAKTCPMMNEMMQQMMGGSEDAAGHQPGHQH